MRPDIWKLVELVTDDENARLRGEKRGDHSATIIGNSHSAPLIAAALRKGLPIRGVYINLTGPKPPYNEEATELHSELADIISIGEVYSIVGRSMHDVMSLIQHPAPFNFVLPSRSDLNEASATWNVPYSAIYGSLKESMDLDFRVISLIQKFSVGRLCHIVSQPPLEDQELVAATSPWPLAEGQSISPPSLRLKFYLTYVALTEAWCSSHGIPILYPPKAAVNERGFLKPEYQSNATHADIEYASMLIETTRIGL